MTAAPTTVALLALALIYAGVRLYRKQTRPACPPMSRSMSIDKKYQFIKHENAQITN